MDEVYLPRRQIPSCGGGGGGGGVVMMMMMMRIDGVVSVGGGVGGVGVDESAKITSRVSREGHECPSSHVRRRRGRTTRSSSSSSSAAAVQLPQTFPAQ